MKQSDVKPELITAWKEYNKTMRRCRSKEKTLEEFLKYVQGKTRLKRKGAVDPLRATTLIRESPKVPSGIGIGVAPPKKQENQYTGGNLLGIATMHKSNAVPVFKQSDAEELAKMRRG
jgi:hypothetical protein